MDKTTVKIIRAYSQAARTIGMLQGMLQSLIDAAHQDGSFFCEVLERVEEGQAEVNQEVKKTLRMFKETYAEELSHE